jgi:hypothetical protein
VEPTSILSKEKFRKARGIGLVLLATGLTLLGAATAVAPSVWFTPLVLLSGAFLSSTWTLRLFLRSYESYVRLAPAYEAAAALRAANAKTSRQVVRAWSWFTKVLLLSFSAGLAALSLIFLFSPYWWFSFFAVPFAFLPCYIVWASVR